MVERKITRAVLALMACVTTGAILRVGFLPMAVPQPAASAQVLQDQLELKGWKLTRTLKPRKGRIVSTSASAVYSLRNSDPEIELLITPTRVRGADSLSVKTILEASGDSTENSIRVNHHQDALLISAPYRGERSAATCIVPGGADTESDRLVKLRLTNDPANTNINRLKMLLGLQQPREWGCLFVKLSTKDSSSAQTQLLRTWDTVQTALKSKT
jgi:hypothetical protein